ncbi:serine hydrolase [Streptomyces sp. NPDC001068]|uniref:serine hydrolase n=1 Tax=Streptomyces sp. NPDC001068 TaxID=3364544 RepID=UPI00368B6238
MSVALLDERTRKWAADDRRELTAREHDLATAMVENSDNDATSTLWATIGRAGGLDKANERLGLKQTKGGEGTVWGLTQTTAADQVRLLQDVFGSVSPLDAASRATVRHLMSHIATDQDWGVSAAADTGTSTALKNGWLQRSQTSLWDVNSIGRIEKNGRIFYVAVLMNGADTEQHGIGLVEQAARAAVTSFAKSLDRGATP